MASTEKHSPVPIQACLRAIEITDTGNLRIKKIYFVVVSLDDRVVAESERKSNENSSLHWPEKHIFEVHPSSTVNIKLYRESRFPGVKHLVGEHIGKVVDLLENGGTSMDLKDEYGVVIVPKLELDMSLASVTDEEFRNFMKIIDENVARIAGTMRAPAGLATIGTVLQITKSIMDVVSKANPILQASWTVLSTVYNAVQEVELQDDSVRELAESLRELLGIAKENSRLLVIEDTTNVIDDIGRMSLKVTSLIYEYTRPNFSWRALKSQLSKDLKDRIGKCQKACVELREKLQIRLILEMSKMTKEIKNHSANIQIMLDTIKDDKLAEEIWKWLSAPDSSGNYNAALGKRQAGTCDWFLNGKWFDDIEQEAGLLWIKGTAGCGKTILCSSLIEKIKKTYKEKLSAAYAYFFFDGRDAQKKLQLHNQLIRSLIQQLWDHCDGVPAMLEELYHSNFRGHQQPSTESLQNTFDRIVDGFHPVPIYIVIDSLDECVDRVESLGWIYSLAGRRRENLHIIVASRPESDIIDILQQEDFINCVDLMDEVDQDIELYLEEHVGRLADVKKWKEETRQAVKSTLADGAQGMFQWVSLQLVGLKKCPNEQSVLKQLKSLPKGLDKTYDLILSKIDEDYRLHTQTFLRWLCFSARPMSLEEIAETIVVDFDFEDGPRCDPACRYNDERDVLEKCAGLITESGGNVKLAHFSVKEYLLFGQLPPNLSSFHLTSEVFSHSILTQTCLAYLLQFEMHDSPDGESDLLEDFPLAAYAGDYWILHAQYGDRPESPLTLTLAKRLFTSTVLLNQTKMCQSEGKAPIYYAALAGFFSLVKYLLDLGGRNIEAQGRCGTALQLLSIRGDVTLGDYLIAKLLLDSGAEVNAQGGPYYFGNALQAASYCGHCTIVLLLLEHGANINCQGGYFGCALQAASHQGHTTVVKLLLKNGADANLPGGVHWQALQAASHQGHLEIVQLLLMYGADVNAKGGWCGTALQAASHQGHQAIVQLLLERGAKTETDSVLQTALYQGHYAVAELLRQNGADINEQDKGHCNTLHMASYQGNAEIVKVLLEWGANVNADGGYHGSAVYAASHGGHEAIVRLLLENGAKVNPRRGEYGNALRAASVCQYDGIVKLLEEAAQGSAVVSNIVYDNVTASVNDS